MRLRRSGLNGPGWRAAWRCGKEGESDEGGGGGKGGSKGGEKVGLFPLDQLILSKFIELPSDGDEYLGLNTTLARGRPTIRGASSFRERGDAFCAPSRSKFTPVDEWSGGVARDVSAG